MATITTIADSDLISASNEVINDNFTNVNSDKIETSVLDTDNTLAADSDTKIATQKAVKSYVDTGGGASKASTTVAGITKLSTAPASAINPIAVGTNDSRVPTADVTAALVGTSGSPSTTNKFVTDDDTSATSVANAVARYNASGFLDANGYGYASGEDLTAADPVYINPSDSKLYISHGFKAISSASWTAQATSVGAKIAKLSSTQFLQLYNSGADLSIRVSTTSSGDAVDTEAVTAAFDVTGHTAILPSATVCRLSDTTFIVFYAKTADSALFFKTGSISGSTIAMDTETAYTGDPTYCFGFDAVPGASDGEVVLAYQDTTGNDPAGNGDMDLTLSYLTCSTDTITIDYTVSKTLSLDGFYNRSPAWTKTAFTNGKAYALFCDTNRDNTKEITGSYIDINSGETDSYIQTPNLESQTGAGVASSYSAFPPYFVGHNGKCYFGWATNNEEAGFVNTKSIIELSTAGSYIFYQSTTVNKDGDSQVQALPMFGNDSGVIVLGLRDSINNNKIYLYLQRGKIYSYRASTWETNPPIPTQPNSWYSNLQDEVVIGYSGIFIKAYRLATPFDGLATSTVTAPATTSISDKYATTTGLTANSEYFLKDEYTTVGDLSHTGTIKVGQALSTTVLKT